MNYNKRTSENWLPSVIDDMFKTDWLGGTSNVNAIGVSIPAVNILEKDDIFEVAVAAPGIEKENFNIELDNKVLTISASVKGDEPQNSTENTGKYTRREFSFNTFKRAFSLPDSVDSSKIEASYNHGVLNLTIPKREEAKVQAKRLIEIS